MGTPISPVTLDPVAFVLGKAVAVSETDLTPEQRREILAEVLRRVKPHLKYLPQLRALSKEIGFGPGHLPAGVRVTEPLPSDMPRNIRCLSLWGFYSRDQEQHLFITHKGHLFWHTIKPRLERGGAHRPIYENVSWLNSAEFLDLAHAPRVVRGIIHSLHTAVGEAVNLRRARLSGTGPTLRKRQERLASVERLHGYLDGILSRMT